MQAFSGSSFAGTSPDRLGRRSGPARPAGTSVARCSIRDLRALPDADMADDADLAAQTTTKSSSGSSSRDADLARR